MIKSGTMTLPHDDSMAGVTMTGTWGLATGNGPRSYVSSDIPFVSLGAVPPFSSPPTVVVSLAGMDATGGQARVRVRAENVQAEEFNIRVDVSGDCTLDWVLVTWLAYDAV